MTQIKAAGFNSYVTTLREMVTPETFAVLLSQWSPRVRRLIEEPPLPMAWIEDPTPEMFSAITTYAFGGAIERYEELARKQMHRDMNSIYKVLMRLVSPQTVVRKAATLYSTYTKDGSMAAKEIGPRLVEVVVQVKEGTPEVWQYHLGSIKGVLECAGAKNPRVQVVSGGGGSPSCVYRASWD